MTETLIEAKNKVFNLNFKELWTYRQLLLSLAWRDIKVRYVQSYLGFLWLIINPLISLFVLSFVFGTIVKADTEGIPSILFTICGLSVWTYFASLSSESSSSVINAQEMVKKIYFPRLILPLSKALTGLFELIGVLFLLLILLIYYNISPGPQFLLMPVFLFASIISGLAIGIWTSALTIRFRDLKFIIPYFIRIGMFITPIAYSPASIPEKFKFVYYLNPMAGVVEGFRWSILGYGHFDSYNYISFAIVFLLFVLGLIYFSNIEQKIADII